MARFHADVVRLNDPLGDMNPFFKLSNQIRLDQSGDLNLIFFRNLITGMSEPFGQRPVVRQENQPLAVKVETTDRKDAAERGGNQVDDPSPTLLVAMGAKEPFRLIDRQIDRARFRKRFAVHPDSLRQRIGPNAEFRDDFSVQLDPARRYQFLTFPPAPETGRRQNLLNPMSFRNEFV